MIKALKTALIQNPRLLATVLAPVALARGCRLGLQSSGGRSWFRVRNGRREIRLADRHGAYVPDVMREFDYYFSSIHPESIDGWEVADFSRRKLHRLKEPAIEFEFTSLPEGTTTNSAYLQSLNIQPGDVIVDAGAYCGLTAYLFSRAVGSTGKVIALEADPTNYAVLSANLNRLQPGNVEVVHAALWKEVGSLSFASEGNMGSAVTEVGPRNLNQVEVRATTFDQLVRDFALTRVDHVKMDIEGGEYAVLPAAREFIKRFAPKLIIELHHNSRGQVEYAFFEGFCREIGYDFSYVQQAEHEGFPLIFCRPAAAARSANQ